ncbi:MAG: CAP domain-containing protein [Methanomicrobiales archaeon]|nr:CAP domain-containing protein [Methanomicrobiales archaeon]
MTQMTRYIGVVLMVLLALAVVPAIMAAPQPGVVLIGTGPDDVVTLPQGAGWVATSESVSVEAAARDIETQILRLTNVKRASYGLSALSTDTQIRSVARWLSSDMAANHYFDHIDSLGRTPGERLTAWGYSWTACAENIACGVPNSGTAVQIARQFVTMWWNSPGHRANILGSYNRLGVGVKMGTVNSGGRSYTGWIATQDFAQH